MIIFSFNVLAAILEMLLNGLLQSTDCVLINGCYNKNISCQTVQAGLLLNKLIQLVIDDYYNLCLGMFTKSLKCYLTSDHHQMLGLH